MSDHSIASVKRQALSQGVDPIDIDALLAFTLQKDRTFLFTWPETRLTPEQYSLFAELLVRRAQGEPIAYLVGEREFWSLTIKTDTSTLIPRPDTEVLVETVLSHFDQQPIRCIDLGTGTGAIALALKSERPSWQVTGTDRLHKAVQLARENAQRLNLDVDFETRHWCAGLAPESVQVFVSNPPYIDAADPHLSQGDVRFEPASALVADNTGLADFQHIAAEAINCLMENGALFFEHGWQQGEAVRSILQQSGFQRVQTVVDYGGNERVSFGIKRPSPK